MSNSPQQQKKTYIAAIITAIVVFGLIWYFAEYRPSHRSGQYGAGDIVLPSSLVPQATTSSQPTVSEVGWQTYKNPSPAFSFNYPPQYKIGGFTDSTGQTILLQGATTTGFQIFITPYSGSSTITPADIAGNSPSLDVENPQTIQVLGGSGLAFTSNNHLDGPSQEIWFVRGNYIYEVSSPISQNAGTSSENLAASVIESWKFQ